MTNQHIDDDAAILDTCIPEGHKVEGLEYGAHVSRTASGWSGYYVRPVGTETWGVARLTPAGDELPDCDDGETQDEAIVRCISNELD